MQIILKPVGNFSKHRQGFMPEAVVIHSTGKALQEAFADCSNPKEHLSYHYLIGNEGQVWKLIDDRHTAWHSRGVTNPTWKLVKKDINPNLYTIGIALEGGASITTSTEACESAAQLISQLASKWDFPLDGLHVIGHDQIDTLNSQDDPGKGFDLSKLIELSNSLNSSFPKEEKLAGINLAELLNQISVLRLSQAAIETDNRKLQARVSELESNQSFETRSQTQVLSEEVYKLQQEKNDLQRKLATLQYRYSQLHHESRQYLASVSTKELLLAILRRLKITRRPA